MGFAITSLGMTWHMTCCKSHLSQGKGKCTCLLSRYPIDFSGLYSLHPWYWNTLFNRLISSGENATFAHSAAAIVNHYNFSFLCSTRYPTLLGKQRQYQMRSLPDTCTHDQQWESNPRHLDLESNAPSTRPRAPKI